MFQLGCGGGDRGDDIADGLFELAGDFLHGALLGRLTLFQVDRDGKIHVQQGGAQEGSGIARVHRGAFGIRLRAISRRLELDARRKEFGLAVARDQGDDTLHDEAVAGDVPARLKTDAGVRLADTTDRGDVLLREVPAQDERPVLDLLVLRHVHYAVAAEIARDLRPAADMGVELLEHAGERIAHDG